MERDSQQVSGMGAQVPQGTSGMAVSGLVLGIVAIISSWMPIINNFSFLLAILGLVFSGVGVSATTRGKRSGKGLAIAALVLNILSLVIVLVTQGMYGAAIDAAM